MLANKKHTREHLLSSRAHVGVNTLCLCRCHRKGPARRLDVSPVLGHPPCCPACSKYPSPGSFCHNSEWYRTPCFKNSVVHFCEGRCLQPASQYFLVDGYSHPFGVCAAKSALERVVHWNLQWLKHAGHTSRYDCHSRFKYVKLFPHILSHMSLEAIQNKKGLHVEIYTRPLLPITFQLVPDQTVSYLFFFLYSNISQFSGSIYIYWF